jgi:hypothetical protein
VDTPEPVPVARSEARDSVLALIYAYSRLVDRGDFDAVGELFARGTYRVSPTRTLAGTAIGELLRSRVRVYDDGTPHTMHVNPNVVITFDNALSRAEAWVPVQVFQEIAGAIRCIFLGHYEDVFETDGTEWYFASRTAITERVGDMSAHLAQFEARR